MRHPKNNDQPSLSIRAGKVVYQSRVRSSWELAVNQLAVIGEYTTAAGPLADDYFLVFITESGSRYVASFYSDGRDSLLLELGQALDSQLQCGLCNSIDLKSRVMWPAAIRDKPLFNFVPVEPATLGARIKEWFLPSCELSTAPEVREFLGNRRRAV